MSFNVSAKGKQGDVLAAVNADTDVPQGVKDFVVAGVNSLVAKLGDRDIKVSAYGHLHDGTEGNSEENSATVLVVPCEAEQAVAEKSETKAA